MMVESDALVRDYLGRLEVAAKVLPTDRRRELRAEILRAMLSNRRCFRHFIDPNTSLRSGDSSWPARMLTYGVRSQRS
jgi:hypothetical protein